MKPWRKIVDRKRETEEHLGKGRGFTWWMTESTTLTLECGHTKVYRGMGVPAKKVRCDGCSPEMCAECGNVCEPFLDSPEEVQILERLSAETGERVGVLRARRDAVSACVACVACGTIFVNGAPHPKGVRLKPQVRAESAT